MPVEFKRWGKQRRVWVNVNIHILHSSEEGIDLAVTAPDDGILINLESVRPIE